jgi:hypothetical protein
MSANGMAPLTICSQMPATMKPIAKPAVQAVSPTCKGGGSCTRGKALERVGFGAFAEQ